MDRFKIINETLNGVKLIETKPIIDERGFFQRLLCSNDFKKIGLEKDIVNINHSKTLAMGTIRGMHFQYQPSSEIKIVKCIKGSIFDVVIDIRKDSPTFLHYYGAELSHLNNRMLYIPEGFAHGFQSLQDDTEIIYFVTNYYSSECESGLNPFDSKIDIKWPLECKNISEKDNNANRINNDFNGVDLRNCT
jgi:dTDP-4-dehydrorhamnose 3,5-epimerase